MLKLYVWLKDLLRNERGQDMVEYALITVLISVAIVLAVLLILPGAFTTWAEGLEACIADSTGASCPF
jgi:Flp pilus assembly pilin Flp